MPAVIRKIIEKYMSKEHEIPVWVNPLVMFNKDNILEQDQFSFESIFEFICSMNIGVNSDEIIKRYKKITLAEKPVQLVAPPAESEILNKLIWPLRNAKISFMLGNYLGTISLCGMASEMSCMLLYNMSEFKIQNKKMSESEERKLFGSSFEKLGQERRVSILKVYKLIDEETFDAFNLIRLTRKKYLHFWSQDHRTIKNDSIKIYEATYLIIIKIIGQEIRDGKIYYNPHFLSYLKKKGFCPI